MADVGSTTALVPSTSTRSTWLPWDAEQAQALVTDGADRMYVFYRGQQPGRQYLGVAFRRSD